MQHKQLEAKAACEALSLKFNDLSERLAEAQRELDGVLLEKKIAIERVSDPLTIASFHRDHDEERAFIAAKIQSTQDEQNMLVAALLAAQREIAAVQMSRPEPTAKMSPEEAVNHLGTRLSALDQKAQRLVMRREQLKKEHALRRANIIRSLEVESAAKDKRIEQLTQQYQQCLEAHDAANAEQGTLEQSLDQCERLISMNNLRSK
jgi:hypothetical protein